MTETPMLPEALSGSALSVVLADRGWPDTEQTREIVRWASQRTVDLMSVMRQQSGVDEQVRAGALLKTALDRYVFPAEVPDRLFREQDALRALRAWDIACGTLEPEAAPAERREAA